MTKRATTIVCFCAAAVLAAGLALATGCNGYYNGKSLGDIDDTAAVEQQGGFLVEKGDYIYFVNGDESYTATNKYGNVVKGSIMRLSREDLAARNYGNAETVVPLVVYSGNNDAGIFIYGDRVYYATPSAEKSADGEVLNDYLEFKSSKLDGTETMKKYYVQVDSNTTEYRYVEVDGTVYLLYVAEDESYFDETTGVTNLHSYNTEDKTDTILAYNISSYLFDSDDVSNPRVYYTMDVENYASGSSFGYNQVYTVTADAQYVEPTDENPGNGIILDEDHSPEDVFGEEIIGWTTKEAVEDDDDDDNDYDYDRYINLGQLVYDGIGTIDVSTNGNGFEYGYTPFNYGYSRATSENDTAYCNDVSYTFSLGAYTNHYLFYTRDTSNISNYFFDEKESDILADDWTPLDTHASSEKILTDGSSASSYMYMFDKNGVFAGVLYAEATGISVNYLDTAEWKEDTDGSWYVDVDETKIGSMRDTGTTDTADPQSSDDVIKGQLQTEDRAYEDSQYFYIDRDSAATLLFTQGNYIYYSTTGTNGISLWRVDYTGRWQDYNGMPQEVDPSGDYIPVQILDIDAVSGWYNPAIVDNQLIFAADFDDMTTFNYLMVCDLRATDENGNFILEDQNDPYSYKMMTNKEISAYNDKLSDLQDAIDDYSDTDNYPDADYANMYNAIQFAYITRDNEYIDDLAVMCNEAAWDEDEDADPVYSDKTLALYHNFVRAKGDWADYAEDYKVINGETVYSNSRDYYYSLFGVMSDDDADSWLDEAKSSYLQDEPDISWYDSLSTAWKVVFIVGMCLCGLVVIAAITLLTVFLVRRSKRRAKAREAAKIKVKTDVNREENVYDTASQDIPQDTVMDMEGNIISGGDASADASEPVEAEPEDTPADGPAEDEGPEDAE
ncbi:MAG: hypothetical protein LUD51_02635 [Clostridia bacterium]|nr:hypothetical protein [Clostridia bacterium]